MIDYSKIPQSTQGSCILIHSVTGGGKTYSAVTLPDPILFMNKEPKSPIEVHKAIIGQDGWFVLPNGKKIQYFEPESFDDEMEFVNKLIINAKASKCPYLSLFNDGLTFTQSNYKQALEDDRYEARLIDESEKTTRRGMVDRFRFERPDWGTIASMMSRQSKVYNQLSKLGVVVIATAISVEAPSYARAMSYAPGLQGREFGMLLHGFFSYIGFVIQPYELRADGTEILPKISFVPTSDSFGNSYMARCSSESLAKKGPAPLNWEKILKVIRENK